jgi:hypothetical protein
MSLLPSLNGTANFLFCPNYWLVKDLSMTILIGRMEEGRKDITTKYLSTSLPLVVYGPLLLCRTVIFAHVNTTNFYSPRLFKPNI